MKKSVKNKLIYKFRIHDESEESEIFKLIKGRKFGISYRLYEWNEYSTVEEFVKDRATMSLESYENEFDYMIRVYFNDQTKRDHFQKKVRGLLGFYYCGNQDCNRKDECPYSIHNCPLGGRIEYLWRCILADEYCYTVKEG